MGIVQFTPFGRGRTSNADSHIQVPYNVLQLLSEGNVASSAVVKQFSGWESGNLRESSSSNIAPSTGTIEASTSQAYTGNYSLHLDFIADANGPNITIWAPSPINGFVGGGFGSAGLFFSCRLYIVSTPGVSEMLITYWQAAMGMSIRLLSGGKLAVYDDGDDLLGTTADALSLNAWHLLECKQLESNGNWELRIDDRSVLSGNTAWLVADVQHIILGKAVNKNDGGYEVYFDDVIVTTIGYIRQPALVRMLQVDADGTYTAWNGDYTDVDEIPASEQTGSDEMYPTVLDEEVTVTCKNMSTLGSLGYSNTIAAVRTNLLLREDLNGQGIKIFVRYGVANTYMDEYTALTAAYNRAFSQLMLVIPAGGGASGDNWAAAEVDRLQFGVKFSTQTVEGLPYWGSGQIHVLMTDEDGHLGEDNFHPNADIHETFFSWDAHNHVDGSLAIDSIGHKQLITAKEHAAHCRVLQSQSMKMLTIFGEFAFVFMLDDGGTSTQRVDFASTSYAGQSFISGTFPKVLFSRYFPVTYPGRYDILLLLDSVDSSGFYVTGTYLGDPPAAGLWVYCSYLAVGSAPGVLLHPEE